MSEAALARKQCYSHQFSFFYDARIRILRLLIGVQVIERMLGKDQARHQSRLC